MQANFYGGKPHPNLQSWVLGRKCQRRGWRKKEAVEGNWAGKKKIKKKTEPNGLAWR